MLGARPRLRPPCPAGPRTPSPAIPRATPHPLPAFAVHTTESRSKRAKAWAYIRQFAPLAPTRAKRRALRAFAKANGRAADYITAGLSAGSWLRYVSWLRKFRTYLQVLACDKRKAGPTPRMMKHNGIALEFLAMVADENKGRTRAAAALRAINFIRALLGIPRLSDDPRAGLLIRGVARYNPHKPKGAVPFPVIAIVAIVQAWGGSPKWWRRMTALAIFVAFVALLRGKGLLGIPSRGVTWLSGFRETTDPAKLPKRHTGAMLLVPQRKTRMTGHSYATLKAGKVTRLLARHVRWLRALPRPPRFLFPARKKTWRAGKPSWVPNRTKAMASSSMLFLVRRALCVAGGLSQAQAKRFTMHSLRVGGINYYRMLGVPLELRAQLADHLSLPSSLRYLRMAPHQQVQVLSTIVGRRRAATSRARKPRLK